MRIPRVHYSKFRGKLFGSDRSTAEDAIKMKREIQADPIGFLSWALGVIANVCKKRNYKTPYDILVCDPRDVTEDNIRNYIRITGLVEFEANTGGSKKEWLLQVQVQDISKDKLFIKNYDELDIDMDPRHRQIWNAFGYNRD